MSNLQEVFIRIRENKREQKKLKDAYRDALSTSVEYALPQNSDSRIRDSLVVKYP